MDALAQVIDIIFADDGVLASIWHFITTHVMLVMAWGLMIVVHQKQSSSEKNEKRRAKERALAGTEKSDDSDVRRGDVPCSYERHDRADGVDSAESADREARYESATRDMQTVQTPRESQPTADDAKAPRYTTTDGSLGFDIPHLEGAPETKTADADGVYRERRAADSAAIDAEAARHEAYHHARYAESRAATERRIRADEAAAARTLDAKRDMKKRATAQPLPQITPAALRDVVLYTEIIGTPKGMRRRKR